jgi:hypothetical protein
VAPRIVDEFHRLRRERDGEFSSNVIGCGHARHRSGRQTRLSRLYQARPATILRR